MGGRWPYSWCLVGRFRQDLFNIARNILVYQKQNFTGQYLKFNSHHPYKKEFFVAYNLE